MLGKNGPLILGMVLNKRRTAFGDENISRPKCFFFNDTATTEIYTLSLHDALPI